MQSRVLIIAGSDPSGGAGLQADIKTVTALGGYAMSVVTALTVQNTKGVQDVELVSPSFITAQFRAVIDDIGADAVKIGMIGSEEIALALVPIIDELSDMNIPVILDPVLRATSGDALADDKVAATIANDLAPKCQLLTPNAPELAALSGRQVSNVEYAIVAGKSLMAAQDISALLVKGGHLSGDEVIDTLLHEGEVITYVNSRLDAPSSHGTGCTLASAIACLIGSGLPMTAATARAIDYVRRAIETASGFGDGAKPLNHAHPITDG